LCILDFPGTHEPDFPQRGSQSVIAAPFPYWYSPKLVSQNKQFVPERQHASVRAGEWLTLLHLGVFAVSLSLSFVLTRYVRDLATARHWVAAPAQDRHLHFRPLPRLGGVAIFLAFLLSLSGALLVSHYSPRFDFGSSPKTLLSILLPGFLIFLLGVYDDVRPVKPYVKFLVQAIAGSILFAFGLRILDLPVLFLHHRFPWFLGLPLTILWVLAVTNAFNLIDGLDGLAAGSALFSTMVVFVVALISHSPLVSVMTLALAGAILGFLRFNFNPATIFLGDCGSQFIGFMLSALALLGAQKAPTIIAVAIPVVSFGLPILETTLSIVRRFIAGRPVFTADREHIHHKLLQHGLSHRQVVIVLYAVSAVFALLSLFLLWPTGSTLGLVMAVLGTGVWLGVQRLAQRTIEQRQIFINNLSIRRATEELKVTRDYEQLCRILAAAFCANDFDAFDLHWHWLPDALPPIQGLQLVSGGNGQPCLRWRRAGSQFVPAAANAWSLTLDLFAGGRSCGAMKMYRRYNERDLQLDINLLTSIFPVALAEAMDRNLSRHVETIRPNEETSKVMAAQAG
jgi:UDP-GlcNAc:undecaprenyl-phosphate/decaprenyl-phosphate GlcNAc-1-phosphate transferase